MAHNCSPFTPIVMKLHTQTSHKLRVSPYGFKVEGQGHNAVVTENGLWCITAFPLHVLSRFFTQTPHK